MRRHIKSPRGDASGDNGSFSRSHHAQQQPTNHKPSASTSPLVIILSLGSLVGVFVTVIFWYERHVITKSSSPLLRSSSSAAVAAPSNKATATAGHETRNIRPKQQLPATTVDNNQHQNQHHVGRFYECGYEPPMRGPYRQLWFPHLDGPVKLNKDNMATIRFNPHDVYLTLGGGYKPACQSAFKGVADYNDFLERRFPGKILYINGESRETWHQPHGPNLYKLGYYETSTERREFQISNLQTTLLEYGPEQWAKIFDHAHKPRNTQDRFLIYAVSNCGVDYRQAAATQLSTIDTVDYTKCRGNSRVGSSGADNENSSNKKKERFHRITQEHGFDWGENYKLFLSYKFCLVMENQPEVFGYLTEKILNGFLGGCIPIYYGSKHVFDIFNDKAFIFWDPTATAATDPRAAKNVLAYVTYLHNNDTAYNEILHDEPILKAPVEDTIERYFSLASTIGNATLMKQLHQFMGITSSATATG